VTNGTQGNSLAGSLDPDRTQIKGSNRTGFDTVLTPLESARSNLFHGRRAPVAMVALAAEVTYSRGRNPPKPFLANDV
jgi:hypothetical protein